MRIHEIINEDMSRRGFLKGAGAAAAGMAGVSGAKAGFLDDIGKAIEDSKFKPGSPEDRARQVALPYMWNGGGVQEFNRVFQRQLEIERARDYQQQRDQDQHQRRMELEKTKNDKQNLSELIRPYMRHREPKNKAAALFGWVKARMKNANMTLNSRCGEYIRQMGSVIMADPNLKNVAVEAYRETLDISIPQNPSEGQLQSILEKAISILQVTDDEVFKEDTTVNMSPYKEAIQNAETPKAKAAKNKIGELFNK